MRSHEFCHSGEDHCWLVCLIIVYELDMVVDGQALTGSSGRLDENMLLMKCFNSHWFSKFTSFEVFHVNAAINCHSSCWRLLPRMVSVNKFCEWDKFPVILFSLSLSQPPCWLGIMLHVIVAICRCDILSARILSRVIKPFSVWCKILPFSVKTPGL